mmetsp:Transcript_31507/g.23378  ORF Transcript_31507/g.23378 Transcript_31507/m.23378 type:complete len:169 (+) Transcript_31507:228-734(+)|eukprot:CAMPEP_0202958312 /NCGR_PEP_ID=MMETSP1396-20130829/2676_1 /ASSEMBLY_ACC=CAM_ASM_000872 /TAXON_ID= /ORGANISM="Pseudokeronopsis sp., Strain Brazil" /LENGTH=168 /DNA_ID=CAMNT_0049676321 /DNA_START=213 /DNA_END=719 /DNA_ORIENTATION=-
MITEGDFKILGGSSLIIQYLVEGNQQVKKRLYPKEYAQAIDKHLGYYQARMRPNSARLTKMIVSPHQSGSRPPTAEDKQREIYEFFERHLPHLNQSLENKNYFCGEEMTVADIQYYHEIITMLWLTKKELDRAKLPNLYSWLYERMQQQDLLKLEEKMKAKITKYDLQ